MSARTRDEGINDLLVGAFEGGSTYWVDHLSIAREPGAPWTYFSDVPFNGGEVKVHLSESTGEEELDNPPALDYHRLIAGLELMKEKYPRHYANFAIENDDAETADVFLQVALFGEVIFG